MTTLQIVVGSISGLLLIYILYGIFKELASEEGVEVSAVHGPSAVRKKRSKSKRRTRRP